MAVLLVAGACTPEPISLTVDLRTDYHPGLQFSQVVSSLARRAEPTAGEVREEALMVEGSEDFLRSVRVAEFDDALAGDVDLRVRLMDAGGRIVAQRRVTLTLDTSYAALVLLTTNCAGVTCPAPAGSPQLTECLDAQCIDPACTAQMPELCPPPCVEDGDCAPEAGCDMRACIDGACFCADPPRVPDGGVSDAGVDADTGPPCECTPGETEDVMMSCGACGTGTETDTRTCGDDCQWGDFVAGSCMGGGRCMPGEVTSCNNDDPCGERTCRADCTFGPCRPKSGAQCLRIAPGGTTLGTNYRCCGSAYHWEYCISGCVWSGVCNPCDPVVGCPDCS